MNTASHAVSPAEIMAFFDGELPPAEARSISSHLDGCADCTVWAEQFRGLSRLISAWTVPALSPAVAKSIPEIAAASVSVLRLGRSGVARAIAPRRSWPKRLAIAGTAAVVLLGLVFTWSLSRLKPAAPRYEASFGRNIVSGIVAQPNAFATDGKSGVDDLETRNGPIDETKALPLPPAPEVKRNVKSGTDAGDETLISAPMISRTVSLSIVAADFAASRAALDSILARHHGYFAELTVTTPVGSAQGIAASLRVPVPELAAALADFRRLGHVENESQSAEDVTQQHADLDERLKTARDTEARFRAILQQRAGNVSDVLQVEQAIARLRGEIEQMEAEQKSLVHRVDFATVTLQLNEEYKAQLNSGADSLGTRARNSIVEGYRNARDTVVAIIFFVVEYGPAIGIWLVILAVPVLFARRRYRKALANA